MFYNLLPHAKALKLYCLKKTKKPPSENSIKRLSALFMAGSGFLSVNSEYGWLRCRCQVACRTSFVVSFQAAWARWPQKRVWNIKKTLGKRQKEEGSRDASCQPSPIHLGFLVASPIWMLFRSAVFSPVNEPHLSRRTKRSVFPPFSQSPGIFPAWQWMPPRRDWYLRLWIPPFSPFLGLLANLGFKEFGPLAFLSTVSFLCSLKHHILELLNGRFWNSYIKTT